MNGRSEAARNSREPIAKCAAGARIEPACPPRAAVAFLTDEQGKVPSTAGALARAPPQSVRRDARRARRSDESRTLSSVEGVPRSRRHARDRGRAPGGARGSRESAEAVRRRCRKDSCFSCARSGGTTMRVTPPKKRVDTVRLSPAVDERDPRPPPRRDPPFNRAIRPPPDAPRPRVGRLCDDLRSDAVPLVARVFDRSTARERQGEGGRDCRHPELPAGRRVSALPVDVRKGATATASTRPRALPPRRVSARTDATFSSFSPPSAPLTSAPRLSPRLSRIRATSSTGSRCSTTSTRSSTRTCRSGAT